MQGLAIRKDVNVPNIGIGNGIDFPNFGTRNGIYHFSIFWYKICIRLGILFQKIGMRNWYVFQALMAHLHEPMSSLLNVLKPHLFAESTLKFDAAPLYLKVRNVSSMWRETETNEMMGPIIFSDFCFSPIPSVLFCSFECTWVVQWLCLGVTSICHVRD